MTSISGLEHKNETEFLTHAVELFILQPHLEIVRGKVNKRKFWVMRVENYPEYLEVLVCGSRKWFNTKTRMEVII
jgi:hypothetical protein